MLKNLFIASAALVALAAGCITPDEDGLGQAKDFTDQSPPLDKPVVPQECTNEVCFDITADKDISFIAVWAETCPEALVELSLYEPDMTPVNITPQPHGQGRSCAGIDPSALKFDGLHLDHYKLCVEYIGSSVGDLVITTKAGLVCDTITYDGDCSCENGEGGYGGAPGTGGYGGDPGTGGYGGDPGTGGKYHEGGDCP